MPHIQLSTAMPGIRSLFAFSPETGKILCALAEQILRKPSSLSPGERELIASYVSSLNQCQYCTRSHSAFAAAYLENNKELVENVKTNPESANVSLKLKTLLAIAEKVQQSGKSVVSSDIESAKAQGATDLEIHDTVLIAAAFCMFNRYVDGLSTIAPESPEIYDQMAKGIVSSGYIRDL